MHLKSQFLVIQLLFGALVACGADDDHPPPLPEAEVAKCIDADGDGYGRGCELGRDCNDNNATLTDNCPDLKCPADSTSPGCACDEPGAVAECSEQHRDEDGKVVCGYGVQTCSDGEWSSCRLTGLRPNSGLLALAAKPARNFFALATPGNCAANPCDPFCKEVTTSPNVSSSLSSQACAATATCQDGTQNQGEFGVDCGGPCPKSCPPWSYLIDDSFTGSSSTFVYLDDTFRSTSLPAAASGVRTNQVNVSLNGTASAVARSGGWQRGFSADAPVVVALDWTLEAAATLKATECLEVLVSIDGVLYGSGGKDYVVRSCGASGSSGTFEFTSNFLTPATHLITVGGYLNANTNGAATTVRIDNITVLAQNTANCGNAVCGSGETCTNCRSDCGDCGAGPTCGNGVCGSGENCGNCAKDCGACANTSCGDKSCDAADNCGNCPGDCGVCIPPCAVPPNPCGNGTCDAARSEDCASCPADCGTCVTPDKCGDGVCKASAGEDCKTCVGDCGACIVARVCGDAKCEASIGESCSTCAADCGTCKATANTVCGDAVCSKYENCSTCKPDCGACPMWGTGGAFNGGVIATGVVQIKDRAKITGDISGATVSIGNDAKITGDVKVDGNATLAQRVTITKTLTVEGSLTIQGSPSVNATQQPSPVTLISLPTITVTTGTTAVNINAGQTQTLAPGNYGAANVSSNATLKLSTGTYNFTTLSVQASAKITVDVTNGPVRIQVNSAITFNGAVTYTFVGGTASSLGLYSNGDVTFNSSSNFPSSVYAPKGTVMVQANTTVSGGIAAKNVTVEADGVVGIGSFNAGWGTDQSVVPATVTPACGDAVCTPETGESCTSCKADCGNCEVLPSCGDGTCAKNNGENCGNCASDCGACVTSAKCGDAKCDAKNSENCTSCTQDCGACVTPTPPVSAYDVTQYSEDYNITGTCKFNQAPTWANLSWQVDTPDDSIVIMFFRSATTLAGLATAPEKRVVVAARSSRYGGWRYGPPAEKGAMTVGSQYIDAMLKAEELPRFQPFGRMRYELVPSSDGQSAAKLIATNLQSSCETVQ